MDKSTLFLPKGSVRGLIALGFTGAVIAMFISGQPMPEALLSIASMIVGYYFGSRTKETK